MALGSQVPNIKPSVHTSGPKMGCNDFNPLSMLVGRFCIADEDTYRTLSCFRLNFIRFLTLQLDSEERVDAIEDGVFKYK